MTCSPSLRSAVEAANWLRSRVTGRLHSDSRRVGPGDGFIAWPGAATDGRQFVAQALAQGAAACLVEADGWDAMAHLGQAATGATVVASYAGLKAATGPIAAAFHDHPARQLSMLAVTGTNGKTSCSWWMAQSLSKLKQTKLLRCAVVGTLGIGEPPHLLFNGLTTPDPVTLQHALHEMAEQGVQACAIEASSIGIAERRLDGCSVRVALFTNFTHDHLDYHGSMEAYWQAKAELFRLPGLQAAVINADDLQGVTLVGDLHDAHSGVAVWTYSTEGKVLGAHPALHAKHIAYAAHGAPNDVRYGLCFEVSEHRAGQTVGEACSVNTGLIGEYNVANLLGVMGTLRALGVSLADAAQACSGLTPVPGRMQCLGGAGQPLAVVDYAHTPDALEKALQGLRPLVQQRGGQLWCVFGCGGDRDASKRPVMAAIAQDHADQVMVTSDNPRSEKPEAIISQILLGLNPKSTDRVHVEPDRALAIADALAQASPRDVVLIAGKGHEDYQEIAGHKHVFSDPAHAAAALSRRAEALHATTERGAA